MDNADKRVIEAFGQEWSRFDQSAVAAGELRGYFHRVLRDFSLGAVAGASNRVRSGLRQWALGAIRGSKSGAVALY